MLRAIEDSLGPSVAQSVQRQRKYKLDKHALAVWLACVSIRLSFFLFLFLWAGNEEATPFSITTLFTDVSFILNTG